MRLWMLLAGVNGVLAVALGAAAAHAVGEAQAQMWIDKAARYQMYHALALGLAAVLADRRPGPLPHAAGLALTAGIVLFSGSLYGMALAGWPATLATPAGGFAFMLGWLLLGLAGLPAGPRR